MIYVLAWLLGRLPMAGLRALATLMARLSPVAGRNYQVAKTNLQLIAGHYRQQPQTLACDKNIRAVLRGNWLTALESLRIWTQPVEKNLRLIRAVEGEAHLQAALTQGRGVLIAAPHYGNWELLNQWLAQRMDLAVLYAPPDSQTVDSFLLYVRSRPKVRAIRAQAAAVRQQLKHLQQGGAMGILPDQQPKLGGDGVFAPFFGQQAMTMTLFSRLALRSGVPMLLIVAERNADESGFVVKISALPQAVADADLTQACSALNAAIETVVQADFRQYQWAYKRFSIAPEGNPYWPHCYPNRDHD